MSETLIKVENVSKKFCRDLKTGLWYGVRDISSELFGKVKNSDLRPKEFWAVQDVSFEVKKGECLGLIGHNGAGKSTLLKMLNGLIKPDQGRIEMHGRIGALIELGAGFNPVLTGLENIFINGSILGFSKKEIQEKLDSIIEFSEIGEFINTPVQYYSSGMKVRLGFAIASQMEPDIMLVDEVLAVGDVGFKIKCYNEIYRIMERSAVIFVSHSMPQVSKICSSAILLKDGKKIIQSSNVQEVVVSYYGQFASEKSSLEGNGTGKILDLNLQTAAKVFNVDLTSSDLPHVAVAGGEELAIQMKFSIDSSISKYLVLISFSDSDQKLICQDSYVGTIGSDKEPISLNVKFSSGYFNSGKYSVSIHFYNYNDHERREALAGYRSIIRFSVTRASFAGTAPIFINSQWLLTGNNSNEDS